jgi:integrase
MGRTVNRKLSSRQVETLGPGTYADGEGLYLMVSPSGARRWAFRYMSNGRSHEMGLGTANRGNLALARDKAAEAQRVRFSGQDPIGLRRAVRAVPTFGQAADGTLRDRLPGYRNPKHRQQWENTLRTYAAPLWSKRVDQITSSDVAAVLKPIWYAKPETASRLRGRIEKVLDGAKARGEREGENPAIWRGNLDHLLGPQPDSDRHHAALPYQYLPAFFAELREREGIGALALQVCILTALRTDEVLKAEWSEIDLDRKVWVIPRARTKTKKIDFEVPLSDGALALLKVLETIRTSNFVFPAPSGERPMSNAAMSAVLKRMKAVGEGSPRWFDARQKRPITVHGFRSTFRDWAAAETRWDDTLLEECLNHVVGSKVRRSYAREPNLKARAEIMQAFADFCHQH